MAQTDAVANSSMLLSLTISTSLQHQAQEPYQAEATRPHWIPLMLAFWGTRSPGEAPETIEPILASKPLLAGRAS